MAQTQYPEKLGEAERSLPVDRKLELAYEAYEEAREHRRVHRAEQRKMRAAMQRFDLFRADLEAMGIEVIIEPTTHPVRVDNTHTSHTSQRRTSDDRSSA